MKSKNHGFTLIEISIVLIILGAIAVLAFPGLFAQIERHRGQEALQSLNLIKSLVESCGLQNSGDYTKCDTWDEIGMTNPSGTNFKYSDPSDSTGNSINIKANFGTNVYKLQAIRITSGDTITIDRPDTGIATCAGVGAYRELC